jgi:hypothetical protein
MVGFSASGGSQTGFAALPAYRTASLQQPYFAYLTPNFRYVFNFERTVFDGNVAGARPAENAQVFRTQVSF